MSATFIRRLRTAGSSDRSSVGPALGEHGEHDIILGYIECVQRGVYRPSNFASFYGS